MNTMLLSISVTGFSVAFFHAAIPTHWLPFVMASRTQKWSRARTLLVTAIAGAGHVALTTVLGVLVVWLGIEIDKKVGAWFPVIAGGLLMLFGAYYLWQQLRGHGHSHSHFSFGKGHYHDNEHVHDHYHDHPHDHDHGHDHHHHEHDQHHASALSLNGHRIAQPSEIHELHTFEKVSGVSLTGLPKKRVVSDRMVILGLLAMLTFSPCEGFLPVYLSGIAYGWMGFAILSAILALATLCGMVVFTWLTLAGMEKMKLAFLEEYESGLMGGILFVLGIAVILLEH